MKKVKYLGEGGVHVGEIFNAFGSYQGGSPKVGDVFDVPDEFDHPRCETIKESKKAKESEG